MTLIELARIASRYETDIAHAMMQAVAFAMYDPDCTFPVGSERIAPPECEVNAHGIQPIREADREAELDRRSRPRTSPEE